MNRSSWTVGCNAVMTSLSNKVSVKLSYVSVASIFGLPLTLLDGCQLPNLDKEIFWNLVIPAEYEAISICEAFLHFAATHSFRVASNSRILLWKRASPSFSLSKPR